MTEQQVIASVRKHKRSVFILMAMVGLLIVVADWAMVHFSQGKMAAMNGTNFVFTVALVFIAVNGVCGLIERVLADVYSDKK
ncbi:MAG: hypothetical protein MJK04_19210 [Psychrosphaera sp.]|nr:hypothetical protein [Psychrosphaera sp.]